jgi:hypothetical protein
MAKWNYKLEEEGKEIRKLIDSEKKEEIIEHLQKCYKKILTILNSEDKENYEYEIEDALNLLDGEADMIRNNPEEITSEDGWGFNSITDLIDERLEAFYDICDEVRIWVQL